MDDSAERNMTRRWQCGRAKEAAALTRRTALAIGIRRRLIRTNVAMNSPATVIVQTLRGFRAAAMIVCETVSDAGAVGNGEGKAGCYDAQCIKDSDYYRRP